MRCTELVEVKKSLFLIIAVLLSYNCVAKNKTVSKFLPTGYVITQKVSGDLNKDGIKDLILIIKGTHKKNIIQDKYLGKQDRNRRGIIVLSKKKDDYKLLAKNYDCFSSENEDGGVYMPPELSINIKKGNLYIHYSHSRYGYWKYTFRFKGSNFELIGYDSSSSNGPVVDRKTSINFLAKKKLISVNTNKNIEEGGKEVFKDTWKEVNIKELIKLSKIKKFDNLNLRANAQIDNHC